MLVYFMNMLVIDLRNLMLSFELLIEFRCRIPLYVGKS